MLLALVILLAVGSTGFAQRNLNPVGNNGSILNPGIPLTGGPGQGMRPQVGQMGGGRLGNRGFGNRGFRSGGGFIGGGAAMVPYPIGGGFSSGYTVHNPPPGYYDPIFGGYTPAYGASPYDFQPGPQSAPSVVINQSFQTETVHPQFRDYSNVQLPEPGATSASPASAAQAAPTGTQTAPPDDQPPLYLIAMRDHTIFPAIAYWVQGDTLHYVTLQGVQNHVSLALVDRDLSKQLNGERHLPFRLPAAQ